MYKESRSFGARCDESAIMRNRYPDRIPIVIEPRTPKTPSIDKRKYMTPKDLTFGQLFFIVRKRLNLRQEDALFFYMNNNILVPTTSTIHAVYETNRDEDGFLYIGYSLENTFGWKTDDVFSTKSYLNGSWRIRSTFF